MPSVLGPARPAPGAFTSLGKELFPRDRLAIKEGVASWPEQWAGMSLSGQAGCGDI